MDNNPQIEAMQKQIAELQNQLLRQTKLSSLGMLSAGISHEIQNPLNFVINFSKMSEGLLKDLTEIINDYSEKIEENDLADIQDISADLKENLEKIKSHGERALSIIHSILLQSRGRNGEFLPTDASNIVHEYVWLSYHAMRANDKSINISIHEDYQKGMPQVMLIPQDISRTVLNLVNNACYTLKERSSMKEDGYTPTLTVAVCLSDDKILTIRISDNGMGMSQDTQNKLYDNFFTTKPAGAGTGLGMGIIRDLIVNNHKGKVLCSSEEGKGTTFTIEIPVKVC